MALIIQCYDGGHQTQRYDDNHVFMGTRTECTPVLNERSGKTSAAFFTNFGSDSSQACKKKKKKRKRQSVLQGGVERDTVSTLSWFCHCRFLFAFQLCIIRSPSLFITSTCSIFLSPSPPILLVFFLPLQSFSSFYLPRRLMAARPLLL